MFEILKPGVLATVQDLGRRAQRYGVVAGGAMDPYAYRAAHLLVGNSPGAAAIEVAMGGFRVASQSMRGILCDAAVTGADPGILLDGKPVPAWTRFQIREGQELSFGMARSGVWSYLALAGGIDVPEVLGSRSTYLRARMGGFQGRALAAGDVLKLGTPGVSSRSELPAPDYPAQVEARVVLGPQEEMFTEEAIRTFLSAPYEVTSQSDRMGYRLRGPALKHKEKADILSDAVAWGSIQVPGDGQPIVLMADRQTTGGYPKIATVISVDVPRVAQVRPGGKVLFRAVSVEEAQAEPLRNQTV